jgi:hypothetical protein
MRTLKKALFVSISLLACLSTARAMGDDTRDVFQHPHLPSAIYNHLDLADACKLSSASKNLRKFFIERPYWNKLLKKAGLPHDPETDISPYHTFLGALTTSSEARLLFAGILIQKKLDFEIAGTYLQDITMDENIPLDKRIKASDLLAKHFRPIDELIESNNFLIQQYSSPDHEAGGTLADFLAINRIGYHGHQNFLSLEVIYGNFQALIQTHGPRTQAIAKFFMACMRYNESVDETTLPLAQACRFFLQSSQSNVLDTEDKASAKFLTASARFEGNIGDEIITDAEAFDLFMQSFKYLNEDARIQALHRMATMRYMKRIDEKRLSDNEAHDLLLQLSQNSKVAALTRAESDFRRAHMRLEHRINEQILPDHEAYNIFFKMHQDNGPDTEEYRPYAKFFMACMSLENRTDGLSAYQAEKILQDLIATGPEGLCKEAWVYYKNWRNGQL